MTNDDLVRSNKLSDELIAKLEQIKVLWAEIPDADDFDDLDNKLGSIVGSLNEIAEKQPEVPSADDYDDLDRKFGSIVGSLNEIIEKQAEVAE